jgi:carbon-monoxide dehydrogenase medium subunit
MKPVAFEIARPASLAEAAMLLVEHNGAAKVIAGGQSLGPMLNLRLAQPSLLVDITGIAELTRVDNSADHLTVGACVTTADVEDGRIGAQALPMLAQVAGRIAYRAVRNRGTVGGSLCHADPAADWATALAALGADAIITDGARQRTVPVARLMRGAFETALQSGELLEAIRVPKPSSRARWGYYKVCRKAGEFALAIGAVYSDPDRGLFRAVLGATSGAPVVVEDASEIFGGARDLAPTARLDESVAARLLAGSARELDAARRRLHLTALARAAEEARAQ